MTSNSYLGIDNDVHTHTVISSCDRDCNGNTAVLSAPWPGPSHTAARLEKNGVLTTHQKEIQK